LLILQTFARKIAADLLEMNSPALQLNALTLENVFVQDDHADAILSLTPSHAPPWSGGRSEWRQQSQHV
jgi:hypothetical protein